MKAFSTGLSHGFVAKRVRRPRGAVCRRARRRDPQGSAEAYLDSTLGTATRRNKAYAALSRAVAERV